ncbi:hypothetical protein HK097_005985, partial [Rhizophlyctis rosea]
EREKETMEQISPLMVHIGEAPPVSLALSFKNKVRFGPMTVDRIRIGCERVEIGDLLRFRRRGRGPTVARAVGYVGELLEVLGIEIWWGSDGPGGGEEYEIGRVGNVARVWGNVWEIVRDEEGGASLNSGEASTSPVRLSPTRQTRNSIGERAAAPANVPPRPFRFRKVEDKRTVNVRDIAGRYHVNFPMLKGKMGIVEEQGWGGGLDEGGGERGKRRGEERRRALGRVVVPLRRE